MASKTGLCSLALGRVGQDAIEDIDELSTEAGYCRRFYDGARTSTLRKYNWAFARRVQSLALLADETSHQYEYVYAKPSSCLKVIALHPEDGYAPDDAKISFLVMGNYIHSDEPNAQAEYVYDEEDTTKFDPLFAEAFSYRLAADLAMPLTRDPNYVGAMMKLFRETLSEAKTVSGNESQKVPEVGKSFLNARR